MFGEQTLTVSVVWPLFVTPRTVAHQSPLLVEFSRQKYWNGVPFPSPGDLPDPGIQPGSPTLQADSLPPEPPRSQMLTKYYFSSCALYSPPPRYKIGGGTESGFTRNYCVDIDIYETKSHHYFPAFSLEDLKALYQPQFSSVTFFPSVYLTVHSTCSDYMQSLNTLYLWQ